MKKKKHILFSVLLSFYLVFMCGITTNISYADNYDSEIVMDANTNIILYENNAYSKKYMASTTKILTAICVIENIDLNREITIEKKNTGIEGSSIYLEEGEVLSIKDLLYGLMLRSGNDCAETLACAVSGNIENFAQVMNNTAKKIGALSSNFVNPHGLHNDNHYTTAYDLCLISCYAIKNPIFKEICSTKKIVIPFTTHNSTRVLINKNKLLNNLDGATGIKTGYTKKAGRCLVTSCNRNGHEIVSVVLNCPNMFEQSEYLINNSFDKYFYKHILTKNEIIDYISLNNSNEKIAIYCKNDIDIPIIKDDEKNIKIEYNYPKSINEDNIIDKNIGEICVYNKNNLIFTEKIYTI